MNMQNTFMMYTLYTHTVINYVTIHTGFVPLNRQWNSIERLMEHRTIAWNQIRYVMPYGYRMLNGGTMA